MHRTLNAIFTHKKSELMPLLFSSRPSRLSVSLALLFGTVITQCQAMQICTESRALTEAAKELQRSLKVSFPDMPVVGIAGNNSVAASSIYLSSGDRIGWAGCESKVIMQKIRANSQSDEAYAISQCNNGVVSVHGITTRATVFAVYAMSEKLGIRYATEGMHAVPIGARSEAIQSFCLEGCGSSAILEGGLGPLLGLGTPSQDAGILVDAPVFDVRGLQPFHDFASGPDWWPKDEWARVEEGVAQRRGNLIAVHTYPIGSAVVEPAVWVGLKDQVGAHGAEVTWAYNASWHSSLKGNWGYQPVPTNEYSLGASVLFDSDCFQNRDIDQDLCPWGTTQDDYQRLFKQSGELLDYAFSFADSVGVNSVIGTEAPLATPSQPQQPLMPLTLFYSASRQDSFVTATDCTECEGLYEAMGVVGFVSTAPTGAATVALKTYYNGQLRDNILLPDGVEPPADYGLVRIEGYGYPSAEPGQAAHAWQQGDRVPLLMYSKERAGSADHRAVTGGTQSQSNASAEGYASDPALTGHVWVLHPSAGPPLPTKQDWYEGILTRALQAYPSLDTYWVWTPEGWEWQHVNATNPLVQETLEDLRALEAAKASLGPLAANLSLATCGWVLGPLGNRTLLDFELSPQWSLSSLDQLVGYKYVDPAYGQVTKHPKWVIPWAEDDPRLSAPQLWVWRTLSHADDAQKYGAEGFINIHWRTRAVGPTLEATAQRSWQSGQNLTAAAFWDQWAAAVFGPQVGPAAGSIFNKIDSFHMPRPVAWGGGPGSLDPTADACTLKDTNYTFVDELCGLRPVLEKSVARGGAVSALLGDAGALERFDYWCDSFQYARQMARTDCALWTWQQTVLPAIRNEKDPAKQIQLARTAGYTAFGDVVSNASATSALQLQTVSSHGERGISSNLQCRSFQPMVYDQVQVLAGLANVTRLGLPARCIPSDLFPGRPALRVMSPRARLLPSDDLRVEAVVVADESMLPAGGGVVLNWRRMGDSEFKSVPLIQGMAGRGVYLGSVSSAELGGHSTEYYVEAQLGSNGRSGSQGAGSVLVFPPGAPDTLHTVVIVG